ncbi:unnamed protein product, partial [Sphagnum jensenii]
MHKGLMCFGFHYIVMFGTHDPSEALEFVFWFQLSHPSTFQFPSLIAMASIRFRSVVVVVVIHLLLLVLSVRNLVSADISGNCIIGECAGYKLDADLLPIPAVASDSCVSEVASPLLLSCTDNQTLNLIVKNSTAILQRYRVQNINPTSGTLVIELDCSTPFNWIDAFLTSFSLSNRLLLHCDQNISESADDSCVVNRYNNCGVCAVGANSMPSGFCCLQDAYESASYNASTFSSCQIYGSWNDTYTLADLSSLNPSMNIDITSITLQWAPGKISQEAIVVGSRAEEESAKLVSHMIWSKKSHEDDGRLKNNSPLLGVQGLVSLRFSGEGHGSLNPEALCVFFLMTRCFCCAGGVVGGLLGVSVVIFLLCCCFRRSDRIKPVVMSKSAQVQSAQAPSYEYNNNFSTDSGAERLTRFFSYQELEHATNGFSAAMELGGGGFGTVYKGQLADGRLIAVKKLNQDGRQGLQQFHNEVTVLSQVRHPNLVKLMGYSVEVKRHALLVYEFVPNGSLAQHLHSQQGSPGSILPWETRLNVAIQTADALMYLHCLVDPPIFHRDVKTTNILLDSQFRAKVADFGLSRLVPITTFEMTHISTAPQGTPGYLDPEYHESYQLSDKSDVYSFGVVLMELITAKKAVDMARDRREINLAAFAVAKIQAGTLDEIIDSYLKRNFDIESGTHDTKTRDMVNSVAELAFRCLAAEKDDRPCMKEVLEELRRIREHGYGSDPPNLANHDASSDTRLFGSLKEGEYIELDISYGSVYNNSNNNNKDTKPLIITEREQQNSAAPWRHSLTSEDDVWESVHSSPDHNS